MCQICQRSDRELIDENLECGYPLVRVANEFDVPLEQLDAHWRRCDAVEREPEPARPRVLMETLRSTRLSAMSLLRRTEVDPKNYRVALSAMGCVQRNVQLEMKCSEQVRKKRKSDIRSNMEWQALKKKILLAMDRFPEARQALLEALRDEG